MHLEFQKTLIHNGRGADCALFLKHFLYHFVMFVLYFKMFENLKCMSRLTKVELKYSQCSLYTVAYHVKFVMFCDSLHFNILL